MSGSLSSQAHSGNIQVLGLHGSGGTPSFGSHVLDWAEQINPRRINPTTIRVMMKNGTDANSLYRYQIHLHSNILQIRIIDKHLMSGN